MGRTDSDEGCGCWGRDTGILVDTGEALLDDGECFFTTNCADELAGATSGKEGDGAGRVNGLSKPLAGEGVRAGEFGRDKGDCIPAGGLSVSTGIGNTGHPSSRRSSWGRGCFGTSGGRLTFSSAGVVPQELGRSGLVMVNLPSGASGMSEEVDDL